MAQVGVWGPFKSVGGPLTPGEVRWVQLGEHDSLRKGAALSVTAGADWPGEEGTYALKVDNVNVSCVTKRPGTTGLALPESRYYAGCNVTNTGSTTVTEWWLVVGVIVPDA